MFKNFQFNLRGSSSPLRFITWNKINVLQATITNFQIIYKFHKTDVQLYLFQLFWSFRSCLCFVDASLTTLSSSLVWNTALQGANCWRKGWHTYEYYYPFETNSKNVLVNSQWDLTSQHRRVNTNLTNLVFQMEFNQVFDS